MGRQVRVSLLPRAAYLQSLTETHETRGSTCTYAHRYCIYILRGHTSTIRCLKVLHGRPIAVSGSRDRTLRVWDIQRGRLLRVLEGHTQSVRCLDACGSRVVSGSYDCTCRVWDVDTGACLHVLRGHFHQIYTVAFDGVRIASGGLDTTVRVWDASTG